MKQKDRCFWNPQGRIPKTSSSKRHSSCPPQPPSSPAGQAAVRCNPTKSEEPVTAVQCVLELGGVHVTVGTGALFWELSYLAIEILP